MRLADFDLHFSPEYWGIEIRAVVPISWWRLAVSSRNIAIYITSDYVLRQTIKQFIITYRHDEQQPILRYRFRIVEKVSLLQQPVFIRVITALTAEKTPLKSFLKAIWNGHCKYLHIENIETFFRDISRLLQFEI